MVKRASEEVQKGGKRTCVGEDDDGRQASAEALMKFAAMRAKEANADQEEALMTRSMLMKHDGDDHHIEAQLLVALPQVYQELENMTKGSSKDISRMRLADTLLLRRVGCSEQAEDRLQEAERLANVLNIDTLNVYIKQLYKKWNPSYITLLPPTLLQSIFRHLNMGSAFKCMLTCKSWRKLMLDMITLRPRVPALPLYNTRLSDRVSVLPSELLINIFGYLNTYDLLSCKEACQKWREVISNTTSIWTEHVILSGNLDQVDRQWEKLIKLSGGNNIKRMSLHCKPHDDESNSESEEESGYSSEEEEESDNSSEEEEEYLAMDDALEAALEEQMFMEATFADMEQNGSEEVEIDELAPLGTDSLHGIGIEASASGGKEEKELDMKILDQTSEGIDSPSDEVMDDESVSQGQETKYLWCDTDLSKTFPCYSLKELKYHGFSQSMDGDVWGTIRDCSELNVLSLTKVSHGQFVVPVNGTSLANCRLESIQLIHEQECCDQPIHLDQDFAKLLSQSKVIRIDDSVDYDRLQRILNASKMNLEELHLAKAPHSTTNSDKVKPGDEKKIFMKKLHKFRSRLPNAPFDLVGKSLTELNFEVCDIGDVDLLWKRMKHVEVLSYKEVPAIYLPNSSPWSIFRSRLFRPVQKISISSITGLNQDEIDDHMLKTEVDVHDESLYLPKLNELILHDPCSTLPRDDFTGEDLVYYLQMRRKYKIGPLKRLELVDCSNLTLESLDKIRGLVLDLTIRWEREKA